MTKSAKADLVGGAPGIHNHDHCSQCVGASSAAPVVMDSGLRAALGPGMTCAYNAAINGTACGANSPSASSTSPTTPSPPANQASPIMPVITAAEASTMPTWKAAEDSSK